MAEDRVSDEAQRIRGYVVQERRAALLYRRLADEADGEDRRTLLALAAGEEAHAAHWERVLDRLGHDGPGGQVRLRVGAHLAISMARRFGLAGAMPVLERHEERELDEYATEPHAPEEMLADEQDHSQMVRSLAPAWRSQVAGTLRAGIFGISDGVVSNVALVIGVVGAGAAPSTVVTAGVAGLVAGSMSMGVGEYVSVASQREVLQAGVDTDEEHADPRQAAIASFVTFAFGAFVPLVPFLIGQGLAAALTALLASGALLFAVGSALTLLTARSAWRSGLRQLALGWGAAGATYLVGLLLGTGTPA